MRADAGWLADAPAPGVTLEGSAVVVKECLDWGGLNDKLAIVPRKYAAPWMRLLEAYYDDVAADYKNSEQFQLRLAHAFHVPVRKEPTALAMLDFYFWLPDVLMSDLIWGAFAAAGGGFGGRGASPSFDLDDGLPKKPPLSLDAGLPDGGGGLGFLGMSTGMSHIWPVAASAGSRRC